MPTRRDTLKALYPAGCMPPSGYVAWHEWARAQGAQGLKQIRCKRCRLWHFPQQIAGHTCTPSVVGQKGVKRKRLRGMAVRRK